MVRVGDRRGWRTRWKLMRATTVLSICGVVVFLAYELVLRRHRDAQTGTWKSDDGDRGSTRLILGAYVTVVAVNVALGGTSTASLTPTWRWAGVALVAAGLALRAWAMTTLG